MSPTPLPTEIVQLIDKLQLQPHPEGGFYRETWRSDLCLPQSILPAEYTGDRLPPVGYANGWHRDFISTTYRSFLALASGAIC